MKWIFATLVFLSVLAPHGVYKVIAASGPQNPASEATGAGTDLSATGAVLIEAHTLVNLYRTRPVWPLKSFRKGEDVPADLAPEVVAYLIPCESLDRQRDEIDSNGKMSRGILQFQDAFWSDMSNASGIVGNPDNSQNAVAMAEYAVENGYLSRWSCASLVHILAK